MKSKEELRNIYKWKRQQLSPAELEDLSKKIIKNVLKFLNNKNKVQKIHVFLPIDKLQEINTFLLIKALQDQDKQIYTSVTDFALDKMKTVRLRGGEKYILDQQGIPVPVVEEETSPSEIEMIFLPLLAYDLKGNRLGYGKGFYDKFLSEIPQQTIKVGLSYFSPEAIIPTEKHDVRLDICINPENVIEF